MNLPDVEDLLGPVLGFFIDGEEHEIVEVFENITIQFQLDEDTFMKDGKKILYDRTETALMNLLKAGLIERTDEFHFKITDSGLLESKNLNRLTSQYLKKFQFPIEVEKNGILVTYKDIIEGMRYFMDPLELLVVETFEHALKYEASIIEIYVDDDFYVIKDNGRGMDIKEFTEYHQLKIPEGFKKRKMENMGAKIYIDRAEYIITETKYEKTIRAGLMKFDEREGIHWIPVEPDEFILNTGTVFKVKLNKEDRGKINKENVIRILRENFNAVLLGYYSVKEVRVNGERVEPWRPDAVDTHYFDYKIKDASIKGFFIRSETPVPEKFRGISIVVSGRTILRNEYFHVLDKVILSMYGDPYRIIISPMNFTGMIIADYLKDAKKKSEFNGEPSEWDSFRRIVGNELKLWINELLTGSWKWYYW